jgi:AcrR family transcriptional regulator
MGNLMENKENVNENSQLQDTVQRILNQKEYQGTSIDDITRTTGLTKGALYWHF